MARKITFVVLLVLCVAWCAFIFSNSMRDAAASDTQSAGITNAINNAIHSLGIKGELSHGFVRNFAHFAEFAVLAVLASAAVAVGVYPRFKENLVASLLLSATSVPFSVVIAIADELIQNLSEGRASQFTDVLLDGLGAVCGALTFTVGYIIFDRVRKGQKHK